MYRIAVGLLVIALITVLAVACKPGLFLKVTAPQDESEVNTSITLVSGTTIPGAVVSIWVDDEVKIAQVDEDGNFSVTVTLEEEPNIIEVIASDWQGNEKRTMLIVFYIP